jgi:hypothetical protein
MWEIEELIRELYKRTSSSLASFHVHEDAFVISNDSADVQLIH